MKNVLLTVEYDGTNFAGWQRQPSVRTVQGVLEEGLSTVCGYPVTVEGASRTDAGVHALGASAGFRGDFGIPVERIPLAVNHIFRGRTPSPGVNGDLRIVQAREVPADFHPRFDAKGKKYRYIIRNRKEMPVFLRNYRYHVEKPLDVEQMKSAAAQVVGTHDFACFQATGSYPRRTTVRTVYFLSVEEGREGDIVIEVGGDGFLYNLVRIIAGTLTDVGLGKIPPEAMADIIAGRDRSRAGHTAPPQGLYLVEVYYQEA